jgi:hypothetical protein
MPQLTLFSAATRFSEARQTRGASANSFPTRATAERNRAAAHAAAISAPADVPSAPLERVDAVQIDRESDRILDALHCESHDGFVLAVEPLMTAQERTMTRVARGLPRQLALAYDRIVDRLTLRWAELNQWPAFGRVVEPGTLIRPSLRACVVELDSPSRGLAGRVAFSVERDLARVAGPIPVPVLRCIGDTWQATFAALAYLEPLYNTTRAAGGRRLLRSLAEVRRHYAEPIDPLIVGWLGGGPKNYGLPGLVDVPAWPAPTSPAARHSSLGEIVFLLGHWD